MKMKFNMFMDIKIIINLNNAFMYDHIYEYVQSIWLFDQFNSNIPHTYLFRNDDSTNPESNRNVKLLRISQNKNRFRAPPGSKFNYLLMLYVAVGLYNEKSS